jgi:hypothetical protein
MDKDAKLIFESYYNDRVVLNEAVPVILIASLLAPIAAYVSGKTGLTDQLMLFLKRSTKGFVDLQEWEKTTPYQIASFFDISGISSWPTVSRRIEEYEKNPTDETKFELWLSVFYALPFLGKFKVLINSAKGSSQASKALPLIYKFGIKLIEKFLRPLLESDVVKSAILKFYTKSQSKTVQNTIINFLGIVGVRWATKSFFASTATSLDVDSPEIDKPKGKYPTPQEKSKNQQKQETSKQKDPFEDITF